MKGNRDELIRSLAGDLRPARWPGRAAHWLVAWLTLASLFSVTVIAATGRFREGAIHALGMYPAFVAETLVAAAAVMLLARATLVSSLPGRERARGLLAVPVAILCAWLSFFVVGFLFPAHPVQELGHRDHCMAQSQLVALVNLAALLWMSRRLAPLRPRLTGALAGIAAAAVPAAIMQFACMYDPAHILSYHFVPVVVTGAIGAILGPMLLIRRR